LSGGRGGLAAEDGEVGRGSEFAGGQEEHGVKGGPGAGGRGGGEVFALGAAPGEDEGGETLAEGEAELGKVFARPATVAAVVEVAQDVVAGAAGE
jgi:hypothetical protein